MTTDLSFSYRLGSDVRTGVPATFSLEQRKKHFMVTGGSGTGKSFALLHMLKQDIADPDCGVCLLDPHGSLYDLLVHYISHERPDLHDRVVLFHPARDTDTILGFNPIGPYAQTNPQFALNSMVASCLKAWGQHSLDHTPRITRWLENTFGLIIANNLTLAEAGFLLSSRKKDPSRMEMLRSLENEFMLDDWMKLDDLNPTQRDNILEGAQNRLRKFLRNPHLVRIFGQQNRMIDMDRIIAEKKILLVNLHPGLEIEEENSRMMGILLINELYRAALLREPEPVGNPHPFYCYIDEFYSFITRDLARSLDGTRKFGLFLRCAHQHLDQLKFEDDQLYGSMMGNCRAKMVFGGLSYEDAEVMARQLYTDPDATREVKHENTGIRFRPVEVPDIRVSLSRGENSTESSASTEAYGQSTAIGKSLSHLLQRSRTVTDGVSSQSGRSRSRIEGTSNARQTGTNRSLAESNGTSSGVDHTEGKSSSSGTHESVTDTVSQNASTSHGQSQNRGEKLNMPFGSGENVLSKSRDTNEQFSNNEATGSSRASAGGTSRSESENSSVSRRNSSQNSMTVTAGSLFNVTDAVNLSRQDTVSEVHGRQHSVAVTETEGTTESESKTVTESGQHSDTIGTAKGTSKNQAVSIGVRNKMEEFTERTPVFWTPQEVRYRQACHLMNQAMAHATVRIENGPAVPVRIDHVSLPEFDRTFSPHHRSFFQDDVVDSFPDYYISWEDGAREIVDRQMALFSTSLSILSPKTVNPGRQMTESLPAPNDTDDGSDPDDDVKPEGIRDPFVKM